MTIVPQKTAAVPAALGAGYAPNILVSLVVQIQLTGVAQLIRTLLWRLTTSVRRTRLAASLAMVSGAHHLRLRATSLKPKSPQRQIQRSQRPNPFVSSVVRIQLMYVAQLVWILLQKQTTSVLKTRIVANLAVATGVEKDPQRVKLRKSQRRTRMRRKRVKQRTLLSQMPNQRRLRNLLRRMPNQRRLRIVVMFSLRVHGRRTPARRRKTLATATRAGSHHQDTASRHVDSVSLR